jgi:Leucine-rich repeat (LRR) protein
MLNLRVLYLHQNNILKIENMSALKKLHTINLSGNKIRVVEGLEGLDEIRSLDLSHNLITKISNCEQLKELPELQNLDLRNNQMSDHENFVPFFKEMQNLLCFYVKGNPGLRMITHFRRQMMTHLPKLYYLDDRPIMEIERIGNDAFNKGGKEAEMAARDAIIKAKHEATRNSCRKLSK